MTTITFYSYKGGSGRSLALANAAHYLSRLNFNVVAMDFDLEAPGLHYKFSDSPDGEPLNVQKGVADYILALLVDGTPPATVSEFAVEVPTTRESASSIRLIPAGKVPSREYWSNLSRINWHELFYTPTSLGVRAFLDLKSRIEDEMHPDFLLIDSRTGMTEMGGVATTLLADKVVCLVLPTRENLEGARAVLRSLGKSRREMSLDEVEFLVALSRLPKMEEPSEREEIARILGVLNEEAEDLIDTLSCSEVLVLHSEPRLQLRDSLRVGGAFSSDESILLRDYLRLFSRLAPKPLVEPKIGALLAEARNKIWVDAEGATKDVEELAESFGLPEIYRSLLQFYGVRGITGNRLLRRAERLWDLTRDNLDKEIWAAIKGSFKPREPWLRRSEWAPDLGFIENMWREAGERDEEFGLQLSSAYVTEDKASRAADILLEILNFSPAVPAVVARCISLLNGTKRRPEADSLIRKFAPLFAGDGKFVQAWAEHALADPPSIDYFLSNASAFNELKATNPAHTIQLLHKVGRSDEALGLLEEALKTAVTEGSERKISEIAKIFTDAGQREAFDLISKRLGLTEFIASARRGRRRLIEAS